VREVDADVEREAVRRHAAGDADADGGDLRIADPGARAPLGAAGGDAEAGERLDQRRFERADVGGGAHSPAAQVEDRVAHDLAGAMERDVAAAVGPDDLRAEIIARGEEVLLAAAHAP